MPAKGPWLTVNLKINRWLDTPRRWRDYRFVARGKPLSARRAGPRGRGAGSGRWRHAAASASGGRRPLRPHGNGRGQASDITRGGAGEPSTPVTEVQGTHPSTVAASIWRTPPISDGPDAGYRIAAMPIASEQIHRQLADGSVKALYDVALPLDLSEVLAEFQDESALYDPLESGPCLTAPETATGATEATIETAVQPGLADGRGESLKEFATEFSLAAARPTEDPPLAIEWDVAVPQAAISEESHRPPVEPAEPLVAEPDPVAHRADWQRDSELAAVSEQVDARLGRAFSLAEKGAARFGPR